MASCGFQQSVRLFHIGRASLGRKINIQKPAMAWTERRILNAVTMPLLRPDLKTPTQKCLEKDKEFKAKHKSELQEAYEAFRTRETYKMFSENQMVAICHVLPMTSRDFFNVRIKVHHAGLQLKFANNTWARNAVRDTKYQNLEPFLTSDNVYLVSEDVRLPQLMALLKKTPELQLLGGLAEDRILSRADLTEAAKLPPLDIVRGQLVSILAASAGRTSRLMSRHQGELAANLGQLAKGEEGGDAS